MNLRARRTIIIRPIIIVSDRCVCIIKRNIIVYNGRFAFVGCEARGISDESDRHAVSPLSVALAFPPSLFNNSLLTRLICYLRRVISYLSKGQNIADISAMGFSPYFDVSFPENTCTPITRET